MKTIQRNRFGQLIASCFLATFGVSSMAASTWNFSNGNGGGVNGCQTQSSAAGLGQQASNSGTFGNSWVCKDTANSANKVTVTAWGTPTVASGQTGYQTAFVSPQNGSGFGIASKLETLSVSSPDHAADNSPTNNTPDLFVLKFDTAVYLDLVSLGWVGGTPPDGDFTLMAYKGAGSPITVGQVAGSSGWALVENSFGSASGTRTVNADTPTTDPVSSSWWLISAYSSSFGGSGTGDGISDYFKLLSVASKDYTPSPVTVPEPGSLALMGAALAGMVAIRRRKGKAV